MFLSRDKKNNVYPCTPQFYFIKVGFKGVKIILAWFRDVWHQKEEQIRGSIWSCIAHLSYTKFESIGLSFRRWSIKWIIILATFDLQVTPLLLTRFPVYWSFGSGEVQNRVSRWQPSWISDRNHFNYFFRLSQSDISYQISSQFAFRHRKNKLKIDVQDGGYTGLLIETIFAIFDVQVALILHIKFIVNWPFCSGKEVQNRLSRCRLLRLSLIFWSKRF